MTRQEILLLFSCLFLAMSETECAVPSLSSLLPFPVPTLPPVVVPTPPALTVSQQIDVINHLYDDLRIRVFQTVNAINFRGLDMLLLKDEETKYKEYLQDIRRLLSALHFDDEIRQMRLAISVLRLISVSQPFLARAVFGIEDAMHELQVLRTTIVIPCEQQLDLIDSSKSTTTEKAYQAFLAIKKNVESKYPATAGQRGLGEAIRFLDAYNLHMQSFIRR